MKAKRARSTASAGTALGSKAATKSATRAVGFNAPAPAPAACGACACARAAPAAPMSVNAPAPRNNLRSTRRHCIALLPTFPAFRPSSEFPSVYDSPTSRNAETTMRALSRLPRMLALLMASLACGAALAHAESMDELYAKAKLEQTLVLYGAGPTGSHERWIKDFEQRFPGIKVALTGGLSNGLNRRIEQQLASKRMETDLAIFQTIQDFVRWKKSGALLLFRPEGSDAIDPAYKDEDGAFTAVSVNTVVYAYNTARVPPAEVPKSALDFLKPLFQGQF